MTGTSIDGIDISFVKTNGIELKRLNKNYFYRFSDNVKEVLTNISKQDISLILEKKDYLDELITNEHYLALKNLDIINTCELIGFHGQTIYHNPENKTSIQLGNPQKLSELLNKSVVFNFRSNDLESGGQGAPLAPVYHKYIIEKQNLNLPSCILNIGGIANLSYWDGKNLFGFDTGPGNALMDDYAIEIFNRNFDENGIIASKGSPIQEEVKLFLQNSYFNRSLPKSLDRNSFLKDYKNLVQKNYSSYDIMATLMEYTSETIVSSIETLPKKVKNIIITGGGYKNLYLMSKLKEKLKLNFLNENDLKIEFDFIEAELIAYLSARSVYKLPYTFPSTTGTSKPLSGGDLY